MRPMFWVMMVISLLVLAIIVLSIGWWTERRRRVVAVKRAERSELDRHRFVDRLSHELRNPIQAQVTALEALDQVRSLTEDEERAMRLMRGAAFTIQHVTNNLMAMDAIERGKLHAFPCPLDLPSFFHEVLEDARQHALAKSVELELHYEPNAPERIEIDSQWLMLILGNTLHHALGAIRAGSIQLMIHESAPTADHLSCSILDTAPPLTLSEKTNIFEPFGGESPLAAQTEIGAGLDLYVARRVAQLLGGDISHANHPNLGNLYRISIPGRISTRRKSVETDKDQVVIPFNDVFAVHRRQVKSRHLLLVEDQYSSRQLFKTFLERAGHRVTCAEDGNQAMKCLSSSHIDLALMDICMPGLSGIDVIREARMQRLGQPMPFIMLTGESSESVRLQCKALGARAYLVKPVPARRLLDTLASVLETTPGQTQVQDNGTTFEKDSNPKRVAEAVHDIQMYRHELVTACHARMIPAVLQRLKAIQGLASMIDAPQLTSLCQELTSLSPEELEPRLSSLSDRMDQAITALVRRSVPD